MTASSVETADRRHQVFLSSTYFDLIPVRQAVVQHILKVDRYIPAGMELFSASPQPPWDVITSALAGTDYMVLILGTRYGTIMQPEGISYTEKEYNYANDNGIPVLAFLGAENRMVPADSAESATHRRLLKKFRDRVAGSSTIEHWSTDAELPAKVVGCQIIWRSIATLFGIRGVGPRRAGSSSGALGWWRGCPVWMSGWRCSALICTMRCR